MKKQDIDRLEEEVLLLESERMRRLVAADVGTPNLNIGARATSARTQPMQARADDDAIGTVRVQRLPDGTGQRYLIRSATGWAPTPFDQLPDWARDAEKRFAEIDSQRMHHGRMIAARIV